MRYNNEENHQYSSYDVYNRYNTHVDVVNIGDDRSGWWSNHQVDLFFFIDMEYVIYANGAGSVTKHVYEYVEKS